jgi:hypothetical protein
MTPKVSLRAFFVLFAGWVLAGTARAADPIAEGAASGGFALDGKIIALHYAYAMRQQSDFDEKKTDTAILLTEVPVSDKTLEGLKDLEAAARGKDNSLLLKLDDGGHAIREVVHHSVLGETSLQMSGMTHSEVRIASQSKDSISGSAATTGEEKFLEYRYKSDVTFHARIRDAVREPPVPDAKTGRKLPPGGGEPGKAWMALHDAILKRDLATVKKLAGTGSMPELSDEDLKKGLELMVLMSPEKAVFEDGYVAGDDAVLYLTGTQEGEKQYGTVRMTRAGGTWRPAGEKWSNKKP